MFSAGSSVNTALVVGLSWFLINLKMLKCALLKFVSDRQDVLQISFEVFNILRVTDVITALPFACGFPRLSLLHPCAVICLLGLVSSAITKTTKPWMPLSCGMLCFVSDGFFMFFNRL